MHPPPRRRAAAVATTAAAQEQRSGNAAASAASDKGLTAQSLVEFARQRKVERERKREEEAAQLRAAKLAAAAQRSGEVGAGPAWNPGATSAGGGARPAQPARSRASHAVAPAGTGPAGSRGSRPASSANSSGGSVGAVAGISGQASGEQGRQSVSSGRAPEAVGAGADVVQSQPAPAAQGELRHKEPAPTAPSAGHAAATPPPLVPRLPLGGIAAAGGARDDGQQSARSSAGWSPRKTPRPQHAGRPGAAAAAGLPKPVRAAQPAQQQQQQPRPGSRPGSLSACGPPAMAVPAASQPQATQQRQQQGAPLPAATKQQRVVPPPPPQAAGGAGSHASTHDAELDSAELEARRVQRLLDWSTLLVQASATAAAERVLLGPAALPDSQALTAEELPLSFGWQPPADPAARAAALRQQVAAALAALEQARQAKLALLAAAEGQGMATLSAADRQLLQAEAAADLQAQSLLAHWVVQAACEARQAAAAASSAGQPCRVPAH
ncbi:hypothetical protein ABPG75_003649 [Micractinium tetrahymenae]